MKKTLTLLFAATFHLSCLADHTAAVDFTYTWISGNTYELHLDFYRGCNGANGTGGCNLGFNGNCSAITSASCVGAAGAIVYFSYYSTSCNYCHTDSFPAASLVKTLITPVCPSMQTNCSGGALAGTEKWSYTKVITLPSQCSDWTFIYGVFARSASLTSVNNPQGTAFAVLATLDNLNVPGNSSPTFTTPNMTYLCAGQPFCYNQGVIEPDGDSLVYTLTNPRDGVFPGNYITYNAGYAYNNPFGVGSPITFNSSTGSICVTPASTLVTVTDVRVSEYRNGVLIGSVERDMEFVVVTCTNALPEVTGINGTVYITNNADSVCEGSALCFTINGTDADVTDTLTMIYSSSITGASFTISNNGSANPSGQFCWTPNAGQASTVPYVFNVTIHDLACPLEGVQTFPFYIYVTTCGTALPAAAFTGDTSICPGTCASFTNLSTNATSYEWSFAGANPASSTDQNPQSICYSTPGSYDVQLIATSANGSDTITVPNYIIVYPQPAPQGISQSGDTLFANAGAVSYQWYLNGNIINGATDYFYVALQNGDYNMVATDANGCEVEAVIFNVITYMQPPVYYSGFEVSPNPVKDELVVSQLIGGTAIEIKIYNMLGSAVFQLSTINHQLTTIDVSTLPSSIYFLELTSPQKTLRTKFVKE